MVSQQRELCREFGTRFEPPSPGSKVGIAIQTLDRLPIHGVRLPPTESTCGWFIFAGNEWSDADDFYQPLCVEHLPNYCPSVVPFLALPPGWRFLTDGNGYIDVWRDEEVGGAANSEAG